MFDCQCKNSAAWGYGYRMVAGGIRALTSRERIGVSRSLFQLQSKKKSGSRGYEPLMGRGIEVC